MELHVGEIVAGFQLADHSDQSRVRVIDGCEAALATHVERNEGAWKQDGAPERQDRKLPGDLEPVFRAKRLRISDDE